MIDKYLIKYPHNHIYIPENEWKLLNERYTKQEIKKNICNAILNNKIDIPYTTNNYNSINGIEDFKSLINLNLNDFENKSWQTRYDYNWDKKDLVIPKSLTGNLASCIFNEKERWKCDSINSPSAYRTWHNEKFIMSLLNALWTLKFKEIGEKQLRTALSLRKYIASQFRPSAAKFIYNYYNARKILDFSAGWGDRLLGFMSSNAEFYYGVDPNKNMYNIYPKITEFYDQLCDKKKTFNFYNDAFEDHNLQENDFDLVFTSPPYFRVERYTNDNNQSWVRYKTMEDWLEKFLYASLQKSWKALKSGGYMIINISDVYMNHKINYICDPMNNFIQRFLKGEYKGCVGYPMSTRINSKSDGKINFCEPIWIWQKI